MRSWRVASAWRTRRGLTDTGRRYQADRRSVTDIKSVNDLQSVSLESRLGSRSGKRGERRVTTSSIEWPTRVAQGHDNHSAERQLRRNAAVFLIAVAVHGADHLRRGVDVISTQVASAGTIQ